MRDEVRESCDWHWVLVCVCVCLLPTSCSFLCVIEVWNGGSYPYFFSPVINLYPSEVYPQRQIPCAIWCHTVHAWETYEKRPLPAITRLHLKQVKQHAVACSCNQKTAWSKPSDCVSLCTWLTLQYWNQDSRLSACVCVCVMCVFAGVCASCVCISVE